MLPANVARHIRNRIRAAGLPVVDVSWKSLFLFPGYKQAGAAGNCYISEQGYEGCVRLASICWKKKGHWGVSLGCIRGSPPHTHKRKPPHIVRYRSLPRHNIGCSQVHIKRHISTQLPKQYFKSLRSERGCLRWHWDYLLFYSSSYSMGHLLLWSNCNSSCLELCKLPFSLAECVCVCM